MLIASVVVQGSSVHTHSTCNCLWCDQWSPTKCAWLDIICKTWNQNRHDTFDCGIVILAEFIDHHPDCDRRFPHSACSEHHNFMLRCCTCFSNVLYNWLESRCDKSAIPNSGGLIVRHYLPNLERQEKLQVFKMTKLKIAICLVLFYWVLTLRPKSQRSESVVYAFVIRADQKHMFLSRCDLN